MLDYVHFYDDLAVWSSVITDNDEALRLDRIIKRGDILPPLTSQSGNPCLRMSENHATNESK